MTRRSANSPTEQELEDWLEMLIRYMRRHHEQGYGDLLWDIFKEDYPHTAKELEEWLKSQHPKLTDQQYEENLMQHGAVR
jgi:hypothetical protein